MRALAIACLCLAFAGCSKSSTDALQKDVKDTGHDIAVEAGKIKNDPDVKRAGDHAKDAVKDAGTALKSAADGAKVEADKAGAKAKHAANDVKKDVKDDKS